ncbi:hypothetical protein ACQ9Y2_25650 [Pseudomonas palleroniana]
MPTTITPSNVPGPIPQNGPVNALPLATTAVTRAAVAPPPYLEQFIAANGQDCFRCVLVLHANTRADDVIRVNLKSTTLKPQLSLTFISQTVDDAFTKRSIIQSNGLCIDEYTIENIKSMGVLSDIYKISYTQRSVSGALVVASLSNSYSITV